MHLFLQTLKNIIYINEYERNLMDPRGFQWIPLDLNGSHWISMDLTDPNGFQWIPMHPTDPTGSRDPLFPLASVSP